MFDGERKGVPVLTVLGSLNNDYTGGEFVMWEDEVIDLPAGAIAVFPSNFMYPHEVRPVKTGVRYSYVSWAW
jgi:predicted 2-oxoglutarate/Fe(II)-dependent dioxygenase YbiX